MLRPRIIPCLLLSDSGLVKTQNFSSPKYVGDPLNAVRIFNEKEVDELMVVDIDATTHGQEPDYSLISNIASECRMPLCYGGGIKCADQVEKIISLGVEKIAISSAALCQNTFIKEASKRVGSQSLVAVLDIKRTGLMKNQFTIFTHNGTKKIEDTLFTVLARLEDLGVGEIVVNSIDRDGGMMGYDVDLVKCVSKRVAIPITALGGAGTYADFEELILKGGCMGVAAGSVFVFQGKYRAVLIRYPDPTERQKIYKCVDV